MRIFCIILGSIAAVLGFFGAFFADNFAYIPVGFGLLLGFAALYISKKNGFRESVPKLIIVLSFLAGVITTVNLFTENKLADDVEQTEEEKEEENQENLKIIEEAEGLE